MQMHRATGTHARSVPVAMGGSVTGLALEGVFGICLLVRVFQIPTFLGGVDISVDWFIDIAYIIFFMDDALVLC